MKLTNKSKTTVVSVYFMELLAWHSVIPSLSFSLLLFSSLSFPRLFILPFISWPFLPFFCITKVINVTSRKSFFSLSPSSLSLSFSSISLSSSSFFSFSFPLFSSLSLSFPFLRFPFLPFPFPPFLFSLFHSFSFPFVSFPFFLPFSSLSF